MESARGVSSVWRFCNALGIKLNSLTVRGSFELLLIKAGLICQEQLLSLSTDTLQHTHSKTKETIHFQMYLDF